MSGDEHKAVTGLMGLFVGANYTTHTTLNALILQVLQISTKEHNMPPCDVKEVHCYVRYGMNFDKPLRPSQLKRPASALECYCYVKAQKPASVYQPTVSLSLCVNQSVP